MKPKFTPGPWCIYKIATASDNNCAIYSEAGGRDVAQWMLPADARLSAAAPDLYDALQTIMQMDVKGHQLQDRLQFSTAGRTILEKALSALAKATGDQE